jgi:DNA-binding NarL/FixJ family response regulator
MVGSSTAAAVAGRVRVLLVDAHPVFREGLAAVLEREPDFEVVGYAGAPAEALGLASILRPDLATVDLVFRPGDNSALELTRALRQRCDVKIVGLSVLEHPTRIAELLHAGAHGFAAKTQAAAELVGALRMVASGARYIAPWLKADVELLARAQVLPHETLTPRERHVLALLLDGLTNDQIARRMAISPRTVDTHRQRMMAKLGVHSLVELVRLAARRGEL